MKHLFWVILSIFCLLIPFATVFAEKAASPSKKVSSLKIMSWIRNIDAKDEKKRDTACSSLIASGEQGAKTLRINIRCHPAKRRSAAIDIFSTMDNRESRKALAERAIFDPSRDVRKKSALAVKQAGGQDARREILTYAFAEEAAVRNGAARAITNIGDPAYVDHLIGIADRAHSDSRGGAGHAQVRASVSKLNGMTVMTPISGPGPAGQTQLPLQMPTRSIVQIDTDVTLPLTYTLAKITGKEPSPDMKAWKSWWKKSRSTFEFPDLDPKRRR